MKVLFALFTVLLASPASASLLYITYTPDAGTVTFTTSARANTTSGIGGTLSITDSDNASSVTCTTCTLNFTTLVYDALASTAGNLYVYDSGTPGSGTINLTAGNLQTTSPNLLNTNDSKFTFASIQESPAFGNNFVLTGSFNHLSNLGSFNSLLTSLGYASGTLFPYGSIQVTFTGNNSTPVTSTSIQSVEIELDTVPEPGTFILLGSALSAVVLLRRRVSARA